MGFLSEMRKLLFVKKSVAKSAAEKGTEYAREKTGEFMDAASETVDDVTNAVAKKTAGLRNAVLDKADDLMDDTGDILGNIKEKAGDMLEDTGEVLGNVKKKAGTFLDDAADKIEEVKDKIVESETIKKAADFTEDVGEKVLDTGEKLVDSAKDISESVGEKVLDVKDKMVEKAKDITDKLGDKLDDTIEKAEAMAAEEKLKPKKEFVDDTLDAGGSLLAGEDDFFSKAAKYADGEHDAFSEGKITISKEADSSVSEISDGAKAAGFKDLDGDGDEIIDDATIVSEE